MGGFKFPQTIPNPVKKGKIDAFYQSTVQKGLNLTDTSIFARGRYINLKIRDDWEFASRKHQSGVAVIIAVTGDNELLLVEQFRVPVDANVIELPAGLIGDEAAFKDESPEQAAERELLEETGYQAKRFRPILRCPTTAGLSDEIAIFFIAGDLQKIHAGGGDESESIEVHRVPLTDAGTWLDRQLAAGKMVDPKIYTALYFLHNDGE